LIKFILNNQPVSTSLPAGTLLVDFIRYSRGLTGTKIGCREGDCGACTILCGGIKDERLTYRSFTSCLTPLGNVQGKHIVTIEGINTDELNLIQQALCDASATQCGFCTPGFAVSLAGFCLGEKGPSPNHAIAAIDGNICRCTGYKSIERAAAKISQLMEQRKGEEPVTFLTRNNILPAYFQTIQERLKMLALEPNGRLQEENAGIQYLGGGTDLYVQRPEAMKHANIRFLAERSQMDGITNEGETCRISASATVTDLVESALLRSFFPGMEKYMRLVSSTPIRNMATVAGNLANASPIGDLTIFFMALDATVHLTGGGTSREVPLRNFYKGYKILDKDPGERIGHISFQLPMTGTLFHFEKVSKRTHLDIASVNSAMQVSASNGFITRAHISAGGVSPVPACLQKTAEFLAGKKVTEMLVPEAVFIAQSEVKPLGDARGSAVYKRLLLGQLIRAHFITLFPWLDPEKLMQG
jgi:xanthine dehydrogenase small subunit